MVHSTFAALISSTQQLVLGPEDKTEQALLLEHFNNGASWATAMGLSCVLPGTVSRWLKIINVPGPDAAVCANWLVDARRAFSAHIANEYHGMIAIARLKALVHADRAQERWLAELAELRK